jgi:hypothetical protein
LTLSKTSSAPKTDNIPHNSAITGVPSNEAR